MAACDDVRLCEVNDDVTEDGVDEDEEDVDVGLRNSATDQILGLEGVVVEDGEEVEEVGEVGEVGELVTVVAGSRSLLPDKSLLTRTLKSSPLSP
jgi:hypothetical protein